MLPDPEKVRNILAVRNDRFGEFLLNIPALRALKQTFTNSRLIIAVDPYVSELAAEFPFVDEVISWGRSGHSLAEKIKLIVSLRKRKIDIAVMLNPSKEFNLLSCLAGIPIRVGYARKWHFLLTHKAKDKKHLGLKHEIEYNLELVGMIGAKTGDKSLFLPVDEKLSQELWERFNLLDAQKLVALHPWTSDPVKQWPLDNFQELARILLKVPALKLLIVGGANELPLSKQLFGSIKQDNLVNLTGRLTLKELAAILKKADLLVSGDSGPVHLACCVDTPVLALFRSDLPGKNAARWGPWGEGHIVIQKNSLKDITVNDVLEKIKEKLNLGYATK